MKKKYLILVTALALFATGAASQGTAPLKPVRTFTFPADVKGHFDHFGIDLKGNRLFTTPEDYKAVVVFDLKTGKIIHNITGIARPHAVLYREDLDRIYVTDGTTGDLKIFDGKSYNLIKSVKLLLDADSIGYDPATKLLYIDNGGGDAHEKYSMLSVVDTTAGTKLADIKVEGETIEAMALESSGPRIFVNNRTENRVDVVDREKRSVIATWPVTKCRVNVAIALDEKNHRLFAACRDGKVAVLDTQTGKEVTSLAITNGVDDAVFDAASNRLYTAADGSVDVFAQTDADHYKLLGKITTGPVGRTARLVPELKQYFVAVPQHEDKSAEVMIFEVQ